MSEPDEPLVELGVVGAAQGLKGEVRVRSFCADPLALGSYGPLRDEGGRRFTVAAARPLGTPGMLAVRFEGVSDRTAAERLNGTRLFVARDRLPPPEDEEEFYHADLVGLRVLDEGENEVGRVRAVENFGGGDILVVAGGGGETLIPFTRAAVPEVRLAGGFLRVDARAAGLTDEPEEDDGPAGEEG